MHFRLEVAQCIPRAMAWVLAWQTFLHIPQRRGIDLQHLARQHAVAHLLAVGLLGSWLAIETLSAIHRLWQAAEVQIGSWPHGRET